MRVMSFRPEELGPEDGPSRLKIRFVRNLKYSDLYARNEAELQAWTDAIGKVMVRTDFHDRFKVKKLLGEGSFAKVYLANRLSDSKEFAVKAFSKESLEKQNNGKASIRNEIEILTDLDHPNVLRLFEVHETKNSLYLVCEYLQMGSLHDYLKRSQDFLSEEEVLIILK